MVPFRVILIIPHRESLLPVLTHDNIIIFSCEFTQTIQVNTCIFGGVDTTGSALTWFFMDMAKHPEHQMKVQEEIDDALGDHPEDYIDR